ncbi:MAG: phosphate acyltransferase PlsX [Deltaproteobacteria bacterium]|nr:phosphate acyltransferase PlsX [Deltaproteobacteria bacterium]
MRIAVDAMGGDRAPSSVVEGAVLAANDFDLEVVLVGQQDAVERELESHKARNSRIRIVHASQTVSMSSSPSSSLKKKDTSMRVAFEMMKRGEVEAVVSAGNSGAMMAMGMFILKKLPNVERPAILVVLPATVGKGPVLIDGGANTECKPHHLVQFGIMGSIYSEKVLGVPRPRVGVLSNGEEDGKGTDLTRAANEQLRATSLNTIGYVEGRDITNNSVDVIVCDGFTGNVVLKTVEGVATWVVNVLKDAFMQTHLSKVGLFLSRSSLRAAYHRMDYAEYGGAPLIGLDGVVIIAHGGSSPKAIKNAIRVARESVYHNVNRHIIDALEHNINGAEGRESNLTSRVWKQIRSKIDTLGDKVTDETEEGKVEGGGKD